MRCIWQMDGDKVKGCKCEFSPIDMLMIMSGLKYIMADIERHPKDRERAQGMYNQIRFCRYYDDADCETEQTICDTCRYYNGNIPCSSNPSVCKEADKFAEEFVVAPMKLRPQTEVDIARAIVHKMIDNSEIAEDAYPDLRQRMHDAVDEYEP